MASILLSVPLVVLCSTVPLGFYTLQGLVCSKQVTVPALIFGPKTTLSKGTSPGGCNKHVCNTLRKRGKQASRAREVCVLQPQHHPLPHTSPSPKGILQP